MVAVPRFEQQAHELAHAGRFGPNRSAGLGRAQLFHSISHIVRLRQVSRFDRLGWVLLVPKRAHQGSEWSHMGPYIRHTPIRDSRVIRQGSSCSVGPHRVLIGFHQKLDLLERDHTGLDGRSIVQD